MLVCPGFNDFTFSSRITFHVSVQHPRVHIRPVYGRMAASAPTGALSQKLSVRLEANINFALDALYLGMAFETKVWITLDQQLPIHRAMWVVTDRAAFSQRFMFKNKGTRLFTMTFCAILVETSHRQAPRRFENVATMWIVAGHAIHPPLDDRVMVWQVEFSMGLKMALKTGRRILSGINNELAAPASGIDVFAARPMA